MLTLTKKTWKYIFYAVIALVLLYVIFFSSTREHFKSLNPIPTGPDLDALTASFQRAEAERSKNKTTVPQMGTSVLQSAPQSVKAVAKYIRANVVPLLPYSMAKNAQTPDGDMIDYYIVLLMPMYKDMLIAPLAYSVNQQAAAPTLPAFIDMVVKIIKENGKPPPPASWPDPETQRVIDLMKRGETTIQLANDTFPNPGYWGYKYIYGDPKGASSSTVVSGGTPRGGGGSPGGISGGGRCTPSLQQIPGGVTETRCFN
jgi:hypothetical protein